MWHEKLIRAQRDLHDRIGRRVRSAMSNSTSDQLAQVSREACDDTIYVLDLAAEERLIQDLQEIFGTFCHLHVVCEGLEDCVLPCSSNQEDAPHFCLILDPVDGTRGLIYGKRSAWILSAVAPVHDGKSLTMADLTCAVQTEIPTLRSSLVDQLVGIRGQGVQATTLDLDSGETSTWRPEPSTAASVYGGFSTICRFFPPGRDRLAALDDALLLHLLGPPKGRAHVFEDQYLCTGGLIYQLLSGKDRFVADLRGTLNGYRREAGLEPALTCHPYDLCTALIASELGVVLTQPDGAPLSYAIDTDSEVSWCGYANQKIQHEVEESLQRLIPLHLVYRHNSED
ncbi:MAG: fructose-1,6-bisphosphatase/inositol monophosphatase family enzyme [Planctomycetota bacterium]|jgi:fructose-1,6-bisphosphatase/inositol monophosphatase family enzyme